MTDTYELPDGRYCFSCGTELNAIDRDPNGDMPCKCARCTAEEKHDFDKEPNVTFTRAGIKKYRAAAIRAG
jgi:hypothetical protein